MMIMGFLRMDWDFWRMDWIFLGILEEMINSREGRLSPMPRAGTTKDKN